MFWLQVFQNLKETTADADGGFPWGLPSLLNRRMGGALALPEGRTAEGGFQQRDEAGRAVRPGMGMKQTTGGVPKVLRLSRVRWGDGL